MQLNFKSGEFLPVPPYGLDTLDTSAQNQWKLHHGVATWLTSSRPCSFKSQVLYLEEALFILPKHSTQVLHPLFGDKLSLAFYSGCILDEILNS